MAIEGIRGSDKVIPIETLRQQRAEETTGATHPGKRQPRADKTSAEAKPRARAREKETTQDGSATLELSGEARVRLEREQLVAELKAELHDLPDVRIDKIIDAKLRISSGYYDQEEVRLAVLRSLLGAIEKETRPGDTGSPEPGA